MNKAPSMFDPAPPPRKDGARPAGRKSLWDRFGLAFVSTIIVATLFSFFGLSMANATPAPTASLSADGTSLSASQTYPQQTAQTDAGKTVVGGSSVTTSRQTGSSFDEVKAGANVVLEYNASAGMPKSVAQTAEKLGKCTWMSGGWNSGNGYRGGKLMTGVWKDSTSQYVCHTGKGPSGYQVKKCNNAYWPKGMTPGRQYPHYAKVLLVQKLAGRTLTGTVSAATTSTATGSSESWAETKQCKAHGYGHYVATASASSRAAFKIVITERMDVKAKLTAAFVKLALKQQTKATAEAWAKASSEAQGEARSSASCTDVTPPPVMVTPPVQIVPGPTVTVTAPVPGPTVTVTATAPATPGPTVTVTTPGTPGPTTTVTAPATPGPTVTVTQQVPGPKETITVPGPEKTITVPGPKETVTVPGPEKTITLPGPTVTVTVPAPGPTVTVTATPGTTSAPPAPQPQKPTINVEQMNDQQIQTSTKGIKVGYTVAQGASKTINIHAKFGTVTDVKDDGNGNITFTYTAPTEGTSDGTDTISADISAGGMTNSDSTQFKIIVPGPSNTTNPGHPL